MTPRRPSLHVDETWLLDLAHGLAGPAATAEAFAHLRDCADCERRFQLLARDRDEILSAPRPHWVDGRIAWVDPNAPVAVPVSPRGGTWRGTLLPVAAAAVLALVLVVPRVQLRGGAATATALPVHVLPAAQEFVRQRASTPETSQTLVVAREAYDRRDFEAVVALLEVGAGSAANPAWVRDPMRRLYLASACIQTGRWEAARSLLEAQNVGSWPQPSRREAQWVLYVASRRTGDDRAADALLDELVQQDNDIGALARAERTRRVASPASR